MLIKDEESPQFPAQKLLLSTLALVDPQSIAASSAAIVA